MTIVPATRFRAMGTDIEVLAYPELSSHVADQVEARFLEVDRALSRFRPDSELTRLNRSGGRPFRASALLNEVLSGALAAARRANGMFDPTLLRAVEAAGYRESFEHLDGEVTASAPQLGGGYREVETREDGTIVLYNGVKVDLGGYAKGWTVDTCGEILSGCEAWVVNAGGDLLAHGRGPTGEGWLVGIEDPFDASRDIGVIQISDCAVATSSRVRRRWTTQNGPAHHVIDPRTRRPAETGLASVSVLARSAVEAEVLAKTLFLLGPREGAAYVESRAVAGAVFVRDDGSEVWTEGARRVRVA